MKLLNNIEHYDLTIYNIPDNEFEEEIQFDDHYIKYGRNKYYLETISYILCNKDGGNDIIFYGKSIHIDSSDIDLQLIELSNNLQDSIRTRLYLFYFNGRDGDVFEKIYVPFSSIINVIKYNHKMYFRIDLDIIYIYIYNNKIKTKTKNGKIKIGKFKTNDYYNFFTDQNFITCEKIITDIIKYC